MTVQAVRPSSPPLAAESDDTDAGDAGVLIREIEQFLSSRRHTAHPLVTATTEELVRQALAELDDRSDRSAEGGPELPGGLWRLLPDRLLALHPGRHGEGKARRRISTAEHLELTALLLERWGWAQTGERIRSTGGRRCILGAQRALHLLGYGTEDTAVAAGAHLNAVLRARGIHQPYPAWNELPHVGGHQALALVREAATSARR